MRPRSHSAHLVDDSDWPTRLIGHYELQTQPDSGSGSGSLRHLAAAGRSELKMHLAGSHRRSMTQRARVDAR